MEKMMGLWKKFSLLESEGNKFTVQDEVVVEEHLLAAKFLIRRALNMEPIARTFKLLWKTRKGFEIRDMGDHKVLFVFLEASDIDRVLQDRVREEYELGLGGENDPVDRQEADQNREVTGDQSDPVANLDTGLKSPQN
nr:hypothetical protein CFP56_29672 [Quercus suber]